MGTEPGFTEFPVASRQPEDKMTPNMCIENSVHAALDTGLRYAEGIAKGSFGCWFAHAWNVNDAGEAVDYTWDYAGGQYLGRIIGIEEKYRLSLDRGTWEFERPLPWVPEGEIGIDVRTREEAEWIAEQMNVTVEKVRNGR